MVEQATISSRQFMILVLLFTIGNTFIDEPGEITAKSGNDAWVSILIASLFAIGLIWFWITLQNRFGNMNLIEANEFVFGKVIGKGVSFCFFLYFSMNFLYTVYTFVDFISENLLTGMNAVLLSAIFLLVVLSTVRKGLGNIARVAELVFPLVLLLLFTLFILVLSKANFHFVLPMLSNGIAPIKTGVLEILGSPFLELITLMVIFGSVKGEKKEHAFYVGVLSGGFLLAILTLLCVVVLGVGQTTQTVFPSFALAKMINLGDFLSRQESVVSISWLISQVFYGALSFFAACYTLAKITNLSTIKPVTFPLALLSLAYSPYFIARPMITDMGFWHVYSFFAAIILPVILWIVAIIRKKKLSSV